MSKMIARWTTNPLVIFTLVLGVRALKQAKEVTSGIFGKLAKCVKNLDAKDDPSLLDDVNNELRKVDGENLSLAFIIAGMSSHTLIAFLLLARDPRSRRGTAQTVVPLITSVHISCHSLHCALSVFLQETGGPYLCGENLTLADCSFAPKLYHTSTCLAHFKNTVISPDFKALHKYM